ncbi:MAG: hypothetical protein WCW31_01525 [Patescibacteria group bacterium]
MVTFPFALGPADDWDPQGYNTTDEEAEDTLTPGMHFLDEEGKEEEPVEGEEDAVVVEVADVDEIADASSYADQEKDPIEELDELANTVIASERDTIRYNDYADEEE